MEKRLTWRSQVVATMQEKEVGLERKHALKAIVSEEATGNRDEG
jgi:hypothetical protein